MPNTREIVRVFLASPGDLQEERKAIRDVVTEFNETWADHLGHHVELLGWEDTVAGYGRPQQLINEDVDRCDLFVGMIWKRWGTPPGHDGPFTSGFQEEFERSMRRRAQSDRPEIAIFFKEVPHDHMTDPGDDLKKVLAFRDTIVAEKKIFFQNFATVRELEELTRKRISAYVTRINGADESFASDTGSARHTDSTRATGDTTNVTPESSPLSAEGFLFLKTLVDRMGQPDALAGFTAPEIARFRLLANSIFKPGNQEMDLGVHDINLLYSAHSNGMTLGRREVRCLAELGFQHLRTENVPLWRWYSVLPDSPNIAMVSSFAGSTDDERVGAITVLDALALDLPTDPSFLTRDGILDIWFSDDTSSRVRSAALMYLMNNGTQADYQIAKKEYDRGDSGTSRRALECMVRILLRAGQNNTAQELVFKTQFDSLDIGTLHAVFDGAGTPDTETLLHGLEHRSVHVRRRSFSILRARGSIDEGTAERLCKDTDASLRMDAISALSELSKTLTDEEVKGILTQPQRQLGGLVDSEGRDLFTQYRSRRLKQKSEEALTTEVNNSTLHDDDAYFARADKFFNKYGEELRRDVDDTFEAYLGEAFQRTRKTFGESIGESIIKSFGTVEDFTRRELTRRALDILCKKGKHEDLDRIRENLQSGYAGGSPADVEYLGRRGEESDIALLAKTHERPLLRAWILTAATDFREKIAKAILDIGRKHTISALFALELPETILSSAIDLCSESRFSKISSDVLLDLLHHESVDVRRAAAIKAVRTLPAKRVDSILKEYLGRDTYYYNVLHWLDLGISMPRQEVQKVARTVTRSS